MAVSHTQAVAIALQTQTQTTERSSSMGANRTQALGIAVFLAGFTALSGAIYSGKTLLYLAALAAFSVSVWAFRKCKPWENQES